MRWWDIEAAMTIEQELFPDAWTTETFWAELAGVPETRYYVVATTEDKMVGYAGLFFGGDQADVQTLAVAAAHQGTGVGSLLLEDLLTEADRRGCRDVLLEVRADNEPAQRLYERLGFAQISVRRNYYQPGSVDALVLRRRSSAIVSQP
jgi:ribosomal-protein-alanine N-acetyltransferase